MYAKYMGQFQKDKICELEKKLSSQQNNLTRKTMESYGVVKASNVVSQILAKKMKHCRDGELVKECMLVVSGLMFPEKQRKT
jgi:hypothetical protein